MAQVKKYLKYRKVSKELFDKIMDRALNKKAFFESGKLLNLVVKGVFVFLDEGEMDVLAGFA
ncbi:MAG: hypothetical protein KIH08_15465, partial [Candidatus Freyarchaeota archaeon]|nr:hypothetical protein [Candidatus Jordarchaeia archaeon]